MPSVCIDAATASNLPCNAMNVKPIITAPSALGNRILRRASSASAFQLLRFNSSVVKLGSLRQTLRSRHLPQQLYRHTLQQCNRLLFSLNLCHHLLTSNTHRHMMLTPLLHQPRLHTGKMPKPLSMHTQLVLRLTGFGMCASVVPYPRQTVVPPEGVTTPPRGAKSCRSESPPAGSIVVDAYVDSMESYLTVNSRVLL